MTDVIVVGLGAHGSAAAAHLARRGAGVLGLEAFGRGHTSGSSGGLTRVIRLAYYEHPDYVPLLRRAWDLWRDLERETGAELLRQTGGVYVGTREGELVAGAMRSAREHALEHELLDPAALRARLPLFRFEPDWWGLAEATAGYLLPERCIEAHLGLAERHGADLRFEERVRSWDIAHRGVRVLTDRGSYWADRIVVAAGAWNARLVPQIAPLLVVKRVPLFWFEPVAEREALAKLPVYIVDSGHGHGCYGFPYLADQGLKIATHGMGTPADPDALDREPHPSDEAPVREFIRRRLPVADGPTRQAKICMYTLTARRALHRRSRGPPRLRLRLLGTRLQVRERDRRDPRRLGTRRPDRPPDRVPVHVALRYGARVNPNRRRMSRNEIVIRLVLVAILLFIVYYALFTGGQGPGGR